MYKQMDIFHFIENPPEPERPKTLLEGLFGKIDKSTIIVRIAYVGAVQIMLKYFGVRLGRRRYGSRVLIVMIAKVLLSRNMQRQREERKLK